MPSQRPEDRSILANVDLGESYVLGWLYTEGELRIDLDAVLLPGHSRYQAPTDGEWACFRRARMHFRGIRHAEGIDGLETSRAATDATGEKDFGHLEDVTWSRDGTYEFTIELAGHVKLESDDFRFIVDDV